jgi:hypothetical protein
MASHRRRSPRAPTAVAAARERLPPSRAYPSPNLSGRGSRGRRRRSRAPGLEEAARRHGPGDWSGDDVQIPRWQSSLGTGPVWGSGRRPEQQAGHNALLCSLAHGSPVRRGGTRRRQSTMAGRARGWSSGPRRRHRTPPSASEVERQRWSSAGPLGSPWRAGGARGRRPPPNPAPSSLGRHQERAGGCGGRGH